MASSVSSMKLISQREHVTVEASRLVISLHKIYSMSTIITDANFNAQVLGSDKISMIDFWATWCPPCIALGTTMDALAQDYEGRINVGKVNVDENPNISIAYGVTNLPCVLFIQDGKVVDKQVGMAAKSVYNKKIQQLLPATV